MQRSEANWRRVGVGLIVVAMIGCSAGPPGGAMSREELVAGFNLARDEGDLRAMAGYLDQSVPSGEVASEMLAALAELRQAQRELQEVLDQRFGSGAAFVPDEEPIEDPFFGGQASALRFDDPAIVERSGRWYLQLASRSDEALAAGRRFARFAREQAKLRRKAVEIAREAESVEAFYEGALFLYR